MKAFELRVSAGKQATEKKDFKGKVKALTDQTPSQFVRSIRRKRAAQLLLAKSDNVSQVRSTGNGKE